MEAALAVRSSRNSVQSRAQRLPIKQKGEIKMNTGIPIRVVAEDGTERVFPSKRATRRHYGIQEIQIERAIDSGVPIARGPRKGLTFTYVNQPK